MRRGQVSRVDLELPGQLRRLNYLPGQPSQRRPDAARRPYRIVRRKGEWFVQFTESGGRKERPWT